MTPIAPLTRDVVLIGGGHAHALVLRRWGMDPLPGARLTVINPGPTAPYTGMLPGHVAGHYTRDDLDIDLVRLCRFAGAGLIDGRAIDIDAGRGVVTIEGRAPMAYDVASVDVGITAEMPQIDGFAQHGIPAKPLGPFAVAWRAYRDRARAGDAPKQIAVIGGGVAGTELAMAMAHAVEGAQVTVIEAADNLTGIGGKARQVLLDAMAAQNVTLRSGAKVAAVAADHVLLDDGDTIPSVFTVGAAGARPHDWIAGTDLPLEDGFIRVGPSLRVEGHDNLFAAGDCAYLVHDPRPKAGVFAVREAPILHNNLRAVLTGDATRRYDPQRNYLKLISLGRKAALAEKGKMTLSGDMLWQWKDKIDREFMDKLTKLPAMAKGKPPRAIALGADAVAKPLCGGCGAKVSGDVLAGALAALPDPKRPDVLSRPGDDAAVLDLGANRRQVITTDHLRAFCGDTALMTRIAATHALGDIWAMGAAPQSVLMSIILPHMSEALQARTLAHVMEAAMPVFAAEGAEIVGGHTSMGAEMTLGFTVTGLTDRAPIGHGGAEAGDAILLTRPIGTGVILAAEMAGAASGNDVMPMLEAMARPQGDAARVLKGALAMTDVTGFGLAGHLARLCKASGVGAEIALDAIPTYAGALALAEAGHASALAAANGQSVPVARAEGPLAALLHDPQTAGGLLAAVPASDADGLVAALLDAGHMAARIGTFTDAPGLRAT